MAKQIGILPLSGAIDTIQFSNTASGYKAGKKSKLSAKNIATSPAFLFTRQNNAEFSRAGKASILLRNATRSLNVNVADKFMFSRLNKAMLAVVKSDPVNTRGERTVTDGDMTTLKGFEFNQASSLNKILAALFTATIDRPTGEMQISVNDFVPHNSVAAPSSTTHFRIVAAGIELDLANENYVVNSSESALLSYDVVPAGALTLNCTVTPNSPYPLLLVCGIQFFQMINGVPYLSPGKTHNALQIVAVDQS